MPSVVNTNLASLNAQRNLSSTQSMLAQSIQRLSTGLRVNSAKDDAAGLAIAERMNSQVRGMNVAIRNANDGISMAQTAEGALGKVGDMVQRMRELAVQSANSTNGASDRASLDTEYQQLGAEITRTLAATQFNGLSILGASAGALAFQIGAGTTANDTITVTTTNLSTATGVTAVTGGNVTTAALAGTAITNLDTLRGLVST
jgi:flagellin